jgi:hypothetical protein
MPDETRREIEAALADWRDLVAIAEERMDALAAAMEQARWALNRLSSMAVSMAEVRWEQVPQQEAPAQTLPPVREQPPEPSPPQPIYATEPGPWPSPRQDLSVSSDVSEPVAEMPPEAETQPEAPVVLDAEALREEVRQAVAAARAELEASSAQREEQPMTADWGKMAGDWGASASAEPAEAVDEEAEREKVRRAVEEARAELLGGRALREEAPEDVAAGTESPQDAEPEDEEDQREKVRRAVEAARAEMMGLGPRRDDPDAEEDEDGNPPVRIPKPKWQPASREDYAAPVMVIEDGEGHVELARVYEILNRLECASQATLLNYTTHSVSIGINSRENLPEAGKLGEAVKAVFGRPCQVSADGSRLSVQLGHANGRVA